MSYVRRKPFRPWQPPHNFQGTKEKRTKYISVHVMCKLDVLQLRRGCVTHNMRFLSVAQFSQLPVLCLSKGKVLVSFEYGWQCVFTYICYFSWQDCRSTLAFCFQNSVFIGYTKARERKPQSVKDVCSILVFSCVALVVNDCRVLDYVSFHYR